MPSDIASVSTLYLNNVQGEEFTTGRPLVVYNGSNTISYANTTFGYSPAKTQIKNLTLEDLLSYLTSLDSSKTEITDLYPSEMTNGNSNATYTDTDWDQINVNATLGAQDPFVTKGFSSPP